MSIKIGDKVRFLNSTGGGVVRAFRDRNIILVEEEDGFETPVLASDVVVVEETNQYNFVVSPAAEPKKGASSPAPPQPKEKPYVPPVEQETPEGEQLTVYLAFVPQNVRQLGETPFDLYLVNDSNYYLSFALASAVEKLRLLYTDTVEPCTKLLLGTVEPDGLNDYQALRFQAFAYKQHDYTFKPAVDTPVKLTLTRFMKLHAFVDNDFSDEPALLQSVVERDFSVTDLITPPRHEQKPKPKRSPVSKPNAVPELLEVDLHMSALVDTEAGMSPKDMLDYQMTKFNETMRANLRHKGMKIVFIHGKGNGVLRAELYRQLKFYYPKCDVQDANFQKYGFGATMVIIH